MPKKKKVEEKDPHEGRPSGMTFGDFLFPKPATIKTVESPAHPLNKPTNDTASCPSKDTTDNEQKLEHTEKAVYFVCRTKKGGIPVKVESRASGKKVTLIEHVLGDGKKLLQELKSKFGTGGMLDNDTIELQGDCKSKVTKYFGDNKNLLKPYGTKV